MAKSPSDDAASRLDQVTDDLTPREECSGWLVDQMRNGADPDTLLAELLSNGWEQDDAEHLVNEARLRSRSARSVLGARDEIARKHDPNLRKPTTVLHAPNVGTALSARLVLGIGRWFERLIGREPSRVRYRIRHGLCHKCGCDIKSSGDQCPQCGSPIIRRQL
jgi:hypothetical protein